MSQVLPYCCKVHTQAMFKPFQNDFILRNNNTHDLFVLTD